MNLQTLTLSFSILIITFVLIEYVIWKSALKSLEKGEYKKAIKIYKLYPFKTEEDLFNIGFCHSKNKQHQKALKYYNKTLKINPKLAKAWNNKGVVLKELKRYDEAIKCYEKALKLNPKLAEAWNNKGVVLDDLGKYDEALECYNQALKINPKNMEALTYKGITLSKIGKYKEAIKYFNKALKLNPKNKLLHKAKATLHKLENHKKH